MGRECARRDIALVVLERRAIILSQDMRAGAERRRRIERKDADEARAVLGEEGLLAPEYVEVARLDGRLYLLAAVRVGRTRLIDNVVLEGEAE